MKTCLGIGEVMVELAATKTPDILQRGFAGDVFNSLYYAQLFLPDDWKVSFHTGLGLDQTSDEIIAFMGRHNISCETIPRSKNRTVGLYMIQLSEGERSFSYWRDQSAARVMMDAPDMLVEKLAKAEYIYLSGISLAILPPQGRKTLLQMITAAKTSDKTVFFDSNIRPKLWENADIMRASIAEAGSIADIVLPSLDDETVAFGDKSAADVVARYLSWGAGHVIVKNGAAPTLSADASHQHLLSPEPVEHIIDSTAAGDAFNGALMACLAAGKPMNEAIRNAQICSAIVVTQNGALIPQDYFPEKLCF
jgi:2-dehydro-3-deoxygluconokinase